MGEEEETETQNPSGAGEIFGHDGQWVEVILRPEDSHNQEDTVSIDGVTVIFVDPNRFEFNQHGSLYVARWATTRRRWIVEEYDDDSKGLQGSWSVKHLWQAVHLASHNPNRDRELKVSDLR